MKRRGQATIEMVIFLPALIMILGACMFFVYTFWQGIKVQQAANLAARVQGQERVSGGSSTQDIQKENGNDPLSGDQDPGGDGSQKLTVNSPAAKPNTSVYGRYFNLVKQMFPGIESQVVVPSPEIGLNEDHVQVIRYINLPKIPFLKWADNFKQIRLEANAWGGEDPAMYALGRWGKAGAGANSGDPSTPVWQDYVTKSLDPTNHEHD